jgi:serine/threonine protein kinase
LLSKDAVHLQVKVQRSSELKEFRTDIEAIPNLRHKNITALLGCCTQGEKILVYEYMPNKSLASIISGNFSLR